jgi:tetratricopeptide (TPR) repeat protein
LRTSRLILAAAGATFLAALAFLTLTAGSQTSQPERPTLAALPARAEAGASTDALIAREQDAVRAAPKRADAYTALAGAYLQKVRETGDASFYPRAQVALARALSLAPDSAPALTQRGALRLALHDFRGALRDGRRAHALAREVVRPYGVIADANVELGRYPEAARVLQRIMDLKPDLAGYARVSYFRELHGDLEGAVRAMELAVSAGGGVPENTAYVETLLGNLQFARGRLTAARRAYRSALAHFPRYAPAQAGMARVTAARGDLDRAIRATRAVVDRLPLPEYVVALGEAELAAGRTAEAKHDLGLMRAEAALLRAGGVDTDVELALYEATHGDPAEAVRLSRRAWAAAPSVRAADARGWALTRAGRAPEGLRWARRALSLGSRDPMFLLHAGMTARAAGRRALARRWLARALADNPRFSPLWAPRARRALEGLA